MSTLLRLSFRALLGCALIFTLPACDSNSDDDDDDGGGGGGGGGGISLDGSAYAVDGSSAGTGFVLYLFDRTIAFEDFDDTYTGDFLFMLVENTAPGTYEVGQVGEFGATSAVYGEDIVIEEGDDPENFDNAFAATSGSISISSANATQVRGSYDLQMIGVGGTRTLRGSFTAQIVDETDGGDGGDGEDGGTDEGASTIEASGAYSGSFNGTASFTAFSGVFQLIIGGESGGTEATVQLIRPAGGRPPVGTYDIAPTSDAGEDDFSGAYSQVGASSGGLGGASGSVVISASSADEVSGSFTFTGTTGSAEGTITGTFRAVGP
jgi:hypothetical protein